MRVSKAQMKYLSDHVLTWSAAGDVLLAAIMAFAFPMLLDAISKKAFPVKILISWGALTGIRFAFMTPSLKLIPEPEKTYLSALLYVGGFAA